MSLPKLSIFFGAGAEMGYGLPSGGKFALDIFRVSNEEDKEAFVNRFKILIRVLKLLLNGYQIIMQVKGLMFLGKGNLRDYSF